MITLISIASEMEDPYRPRYVPAPVPERKLPDIGPRPSRFDGNVALIVVVMCAAFPILMLVAAMCHHGGTP